MEGFGSCTRLESLRSELNDCIQDLDKNISILKQKKYKEIPSSVYSNSNKRPGWMFGMRRRKFEYCIIREEISSLIERRNKLYRELRIEMEKECYPHILAHDDSTVKCICCHLTNSTEPEDYLTHTDKIDLMTLLDTDRSFNLPAGLSFEEANEIYQEILERDDIDFNNIKKINMKKTELFYLIVATWGYRRNQEHQKQLIKK